MRLLTLPSSHLIDCKITPPIIILPGQPESLMHRRNFLLRSGQAALIASLGLKPALLKANQNDNASLLADVERLIPRLMTEFKVPGLSAAIIRDGKLLWNKAFGVKSNASKEPVDVET